ncbi:hypothetical protein YC2023_026727 [Brassica napus]
MQRTPTIISLNYAKDLSIANKKDNEIRLTWKFYQTMQISSSEAKNINLVLKIRLSRLEYINAQ